LICESVGAGACGRRKMPALVAATSVLEVVIVMALIGSDELGYVPPGPADQLVAPFVEKK